MLKFNHNRGDTIIEVLFAITVFSLVVVGSLSIMNQGSATAQRSLEISLVRNEIDAQAEALRFLNASYVAAYQPGTLDCPPLSVTATCNWWKIHNNANTTGVSDFGTCYPSSPIPSGRFIFIINTKTGAILPLTAGATGNFAGATTFAQVRYNASGNIDKAEGIWIEAVRPIATTDSADPQYNASYIDFHIRACWDSPGQSASMTLGTIVRLYEPIN